MNYIFYFLILLNLSFMGLALLFGRNMVVKCVFSLVNISLTFWSYCIYRVWFFPPSLLWMRLAFIGPILGVAALLLFSLVYPRNLIKNKRIIWGGILIVPVMLVCLAPTSFIVDSIDLNRQVTYNFGHKLLTLYVFSYVVGMAVVLVRGLVGYTGFERLRLKYYIFGLGSFLGLALFTNLILPILGTNQYNKYGPLFSGIMLFVTLYSILKHQLMDIHVVLKKGFFYFLLTAAISLPFVMMMMAAGQINSQNSGLLAIFQVGFSACVVVYFYPYLRAGIDKMTENLFFRSKIDYRELIRDLSGKLSSSNSKEDVYSYIEHVLVDGLKLSKTALYIQSPSGRYEQELSSFTEDSLPAVFENNHDMIPFLKTLSSGYVVDAWRELIQSKFSDTSMLSQFDSWGVVMIVPLITKGDILGFLLLGEKLSQERYSHKDVNVLEIVSSRASSILQHFRSYQKVQKNIQDLNAMTQFSLQANRHMDYDQTMMAFDKSLKDLFSFSGIYRASKGQDYLAREILFYDESNGSDAFLIDTKRADSDPLVLDQVFRPLSLPDIYLKETKLEGKTGMLIPLKTGPYCHAWVLGVWDEAPYDLNITLMEMLGYEATNALQNTRLYRDMIELHVYHEDVLKNMGCGILVVDDQMNVVHCNAYVLNVLSLDSDAVVGAPFAKLQHLFPGYEVMMNAKLYGERVTREVAIVKDGVDVAYSITAGEMTYHDLSWYICTMSDLTVIKQLQKKVFHADRLASLGTMAGGISTQIMEPIQKSLESSLDLIANWDNPQKRLDFTQLVLPEVDAVDKLCHSLLYLGKPVKPHLEEVSLLGLFDEIRNLVQGALSKNELKWQCDVGASISVIGDRGQLIQALLNIVMNAIEASPKNGLVSVTCLLNVSGYVSVSISDMGQGISDGGSPLIFDPFYTTKAEGTGLGLSISHQIVEQHKGKIDVDSKEGIGTIVCVWLPTLQVIPDIHKVKLA